MSDFSEVLGDVSRERFRQSANKLLNQCFILKKNKDTEADYRFIIANKLVFEEYMDLLGYELIIREDQGVITVNNQYGTGRVQFSKFESILLLIIRILYIEKMKEVSQIQDVIVLLEEIQEKYSMLTLPKLSKSLMLNALRTFKRFNLIKNIDRLDTFDPGIRIQIYPSILFAVTASSLEDTYVIAQDRLSDYENRGDDGGSEDDTDEYTDEDID